MSYVRVDSEYTWRGFRTIIFENHAIRAMLLPELGGKLWSLYDKIADREVLWHNPRVLPRVAHYGATYDDWFCGGWDELFPNDAPTNLTGDAYPDHGEWWSMPFEWQIIREADHVGVKLSRRGIVTDTLVEKTIRLFANELQLRVDYRLVNYARQPLDYLWKLHPAVAINADCRIDMPARTVVIDEGFRSRCGDDVALFTWPIAQTAHGPEDMRLIPPVTANTCDFFYATELDAGWCSLTDTRQRHGFGLAFDASVFRTCWVFGAYGGWRSLYAAILEPCTGYPYKLDDAVAQGTASRLLPGQELKTQLRAVIYHGLDAVSDISSTGHVK